MASFIDISNEIAAITTPDKCDIVRRNKLRALKALTGRNLVLYTTDFLSPKANIVGNQVGIDLTDKDGFLEVIKNLTGDELDVIIHSPGGTAEAAESIVDLLRSKFSNIRFIIPSVAKSAATMLSMSGNELVMSEISELGPTDPQMIVNRDGNIVIAPAHAIKEQFKLASDEITQNTKRLTPWLPILRQYGPSLLSECDRSLSLSNKLVSAWLKKYMFAGKPTPGLKASRISKYLTSKKNFQSHARKIGIDELINKGASVVDLRLPQHRQLKDAIWDIHIAVTLTFSMTNAYKIFENHNGEALIRQIA